MVDVNVQFQDIVDSASGDRAGKTRWELALDRSRSRIASARRSGSRRVLGGSSSCAALPPTAAARRRSRVFVVDVAAAAVLRAEARG